MTIHITDFARKRHTTKAYAPRRISDADMAQVRALLRFSPSSTNLQPWHFVIAGTDEGKARVAKAAEEKFPVQRQCDQERFTRDRFCRTNRGRRGLSSKGSCAGRGRRPFCRESR